MESVNDAAQGRSSQDTLDVLMIVQDEQERVAAAVTSVRSIARNVIVVDGGSQDSTVEICRALGCIVYENPWPGYAQQRLFALGKATSTWVLNLDADEVVSLELATSIVTVLNDGTELDGFTLTRVGDFLGRWVGPDEQLRLCRLDKANIPDVLVHEGFALPPDRVGRLSGTLWHYGFRSLEDHVRRFDRYTSLEASIARKNGRAPSLSRLLLRPPAHFALEYFARGLYKKGRPGFAVAWFWALYEFLKEMKVYELNWRESNGGRSGSHESEAVRE